LNKCRFFLSLMWMLINCLFAFSDSDIVYQGHTAGRKGVRPTWISPLKEAHKGFIGISQFCRSVSRHFRRNPQSKVCFHALFALNRNSRNRVSNIGKCRAAMWTQDICSVQNGLIYIHINIYTSTFNLFEHKYCSYSSKWRIGYNSIKFLVAHMTSHCLKFNIDNIL